MSEPYPLDASAGYGAGSDTDYPAGETVTQPGPSRNTQLFLSLFLLILAFFILLVSISAIETFKSKTVMNSLTSVFSSPVVSDKPPTEFTTRDGEIISNPQFQSAIADLFSTMINVTRIEIVLPGQVMRVQMPTKLMYKDDEVQLRTNITPLLDRLIANLSTRPPGQRFEAQLVMSYQTKQNDQAIEPSVIAGHQDLAIKRAGRFATEMINRGAPPDSVAIGIEQGNPDMMTIWFYLRDMAEPSGADENLEGTPSTGQP